MNQTVFHYKVTHRDKLRIDDLEGEDFVEEVRRNVTIETDEGNRSNIVVEVSESSEFERLDNMLEERYSQVWFDF